MVEKSTYPVSYFGLRRGKVYKCSLDGKNFEGKFIYKLYRHWLRYKPLYNDDGWRDVWNVMWYDESKASYMEVKDSVQRVRRVSKNGRRKHMGKSRHAVEMLRRD